LKIHEIFRSIQGEGANTGLPMTFIRTYGCNLSCGFCDTPQDGYTDMEIDDIVAQIRDDWVCITGGEPTVHSQLCLLSESLCNKGHMVALETNGTNPIPLGFHWVCVSPKSVWPKQEVFDAADEIKLLVGSGFYKAKTIVRDFAVDWTKEQKVVSVQPVWDENYEQNLEDAVKIAQFYGVRLSVQIHKYIQVK